MPPFLINGENYTLPPIWGVRMAPLELFISQLANHWLAFFTGSAVTVGVVLVERLFKPLPPWMYVVVVILGGLVVASYEAWQDEYREVQEAQTNQREAVQNAEAKTKEAQLKAEDLQSQVAALNQPKLECKIDTVTIVGTSGFLALKDKLSTLMFVEASVRNAGAPSVGDDFGLTLTLSGMTYVGSAVTANKAVSLKGPSGPFTYNTQKESLWERAVATPIPRGGEVTGVLMYYFHNLNVQSIAPGALAELHFIDAYNHESHCGYVWNGLIGQHGHTVGLDSLSY